MVTCRSHSTASTWGATPATALAALCPLAVVADDGGCQTLSSLEGNTCSSQLIREGSGVWYRFQLLNVADNTFQWLIRQVEERMIVLSDTAFHAAEGDPTNLKLCQRGELQDRMLVETVLSMLTLVCHLKKVMHRGWGYFQARLAFTMAAFNVLVQWHGWQPNAS